MFRTPCWCRAKRLSRVEGILLTYQIESWEVVKERYDWSGLLVGNGASMAVWPQFGYTSLFKQACLPRTKPHLTADDQHLFEALESTGNFELVLGALSTSELVCRALHLESAYQSLHERHQSIQQALGAAVHAVHVPYHALPAATLDRIREALYPYRSIFTTNYDLLLYWAIMASREDRVKDYFFTNDGTFDRTRTELHLGDRTMLYLHGGLHLIAQSPHGTRKLKSQGSGLLELFGNNLHPGETPLLVTEGSASDKLASIFQSDYLQFAYEQLTTYTGPLVIFGHALKDSDRHIVDAIKKSKAGPLAISIRPATTRTMRKYAAAYAEIFSDAEIEDPLFFDATTHPLGDLALLIREG